MTAREISGFIIGLKPPALEGAMLFWHGGPNDAPTMVATRAGATRFADEHMARETAGRIDTGFHAEVLPHTWIEPELVPSGQGRKQRPGGGA